MVITNFNQIDLSNIYGVLLDLDDTLYEYEPCHKVAIDACIKELEYIFPDFQLITFWEYYKEARRTINENLYGLASSHSRLLYFQLAFEKMKGQTDFELTLRFEKVYWNTFLLHMKLKLDAVEFLNNALAKGIEICIVTDLTAQIQIRKILKLGLDKYTKYLVTSEECGIEKPSPKMFQLALLKLNMPKHHVIMVGDNWAKDIEGAINMGIKYYNLKH